MISVSLLGDLYDYNYWARDVNLKGEPFTYPLWQTLVHVVNHQTYHRGQITTLLRQLGTVAVPIDYLDMVDARVS